MSAFVKACKVCNIDFYSTLLFCVALSNFFADKVFAVLYIDVIKNKNSLSFDNLMKNIFTMVNKLTC